MRFTFSRRKERIVELPAGATPVDFAYAVHTDIGHACVGACVDRQPYPLSQPLFSGQTSKYTAPGARPNAAWLNFVVSSKARAKIRQLLKNSGATTPLAWGVVCSITRWVAAANWQRSHQKTFSMSWSV
ncbi:MAG: TGS domain-containing protein [Enterobacter hormaechei]